MGRMTVGAAPRRGAAMAQEAAYHSQAGYGRQVYLDSIWTA